MKKSDYADGLPCENKSVPRKKKKTASKASQLSTTCGACGNECIISGRVDDIDEHGVSIFDHFYCCSDCEPFVDALEKNKEKPLTFFTSHINEGVVQESNYPLVVKPSKYLVSSYGPLRDQSAEYDVAKRIISNATAILVVTGAGFSADSGLGVFRSIQCKKDEEEKGQQANILGGGGALKADEIDYQKMPQKAWYYDASIRRDALRAEPHEGYHLLLQHLQKQEREKNVPFFILTSNIDHMFHRFPCITDEKIYETHGSIQYIQCGKKITNGKCPGVWDWPMNQPPESDIDDAKLSCGLESVPRCPGCQGPARANISHFPDDGNDIDNTVKGKQKKHFLQFLRTQRQAHRQGGGGGGGGRGRGGTFVILEIGCGSSVHGLRMESELLITNHPTSSIPHSHLIRIDYNLDCIPILPHTHMHEEEEEEEEVVVVGGREGGRTSGNHKVVGIKDSGLNAMVKLFKGGVN